MIKKIANRNSITGNAGTCRQIPQTSLMRDVEWASNTCTLTFTTIGIWPENADGTDINYCDRSNDNKLMVTADDFGKVKLYSYPVMQPKVSVLDSQLTTNTNKTIFF